ncbi:hypothetical protein CBER1_11529 [Cercospora berteroae]|uniref:Uncharacterized protein n=1 Tax=Cercospora berteroae TaxID=357750 RepID=A0A2S6CH09_9PEZI|nr:hypothetical protein CBER1_11529 [Cercospora berteroae]
MARLAQEGYDWQDNREARTTDRHAQLTSAWMRLHYDLRLGIPHPTKNTTVDEFTGQMRTQLFSWRQMPIGRTKGRYGGRDLDAGNRRNYSRGREPQPDRYLQRPRRGHDHLNDADRYRRQPDRGSDPVKQETGPEPRVKPEPGTSRNCYNCVDAGNYFNDIVNYADSDEDCGQDALPTPAIYTARTGDLPSCGLEPFTTRPLTQDCRCPICRAEFPTLAALKAYRRQHETPSVTETIEVIESTAKFKPKAGFAFRTAYYLRLCLRLSEDGPDHAVCLDTSATLSIVDENFLSQSLPDLPRYRLAHPIKVSGLSAITSTSEYMELDFWIPALLNGKRVLVHMQHKVHIVPSLQPKMLVAMDIIGPQAIKIDPPRKLLSLGSAQNALAPLLVKRRD